MKNNHNLRKNKRNSKSEVVESARYTEQELKRPYCLSIILLLSCIVQAWLSGEIYTKPKFPENGERESYIHISVDDTIEIFKDLTLNGGGYKSIFDQPELKYCKFLHDHYGMVFSFYCFFSEDKENAFTLQDVTEKYKSEFSDNCEWMKFGFHAKDGSAYKELNADTEVRYYNRTLEQLLRITGSEKCIDTGFIRLDRYCASKEVVEALKRLPNGPKGLLCADDPTRVSYDLSAEESSILHRYDWYQRENSLCYTPTDVRVENIQNPLDFYKVIRKISGQKVKIIFTHEVYLKDETVRKYLQWIGEYATATNCIFRYPSVQDGSLPA